MKLNAEKNQWFGDVLKKARDWMKGKPPMPFLINFLHGVHRILVDGWELSPDVSVREYNRFGAT